MLQCTIIKIACSICIVIFEIDILNYKTHRSLLYAISTEQGNFCALLLLDRGIQSCGSVAY